MTQILEFKERKLIHRRDGQNFIKIPQAVKIAANTKEVDLIFDSAENILKVIF